jgi:hypothetical protein
MPIQPPLQRRCSLSPDDIKTTARDGIGRRRGGTFRTATDDLDVDRAIEPFGRRPDESWRTAKKELSMPRKLTVAVFVAVALSSAVVAANIARFGAVAPNQSNVDFDQVFAAAGASANVLSAKLSEQLRRVGLKRIDLTR